MYGTGVDGNGSVYSMDKEGANLQTLHTFQGGSLDGANPRTGLTKGLDGAYYGATIAGGTGNGGVIFKVWTPPVIVTQPQSQTVVEGSRVTFSVVATDPILLSYQWRFNNSYLPGKTNSSLVITNALATNRGRYQVVVANGTGKLTSQDALLEVTPGARPTISDISDQNIRENSSCGPILFSVGDAETPVEMLSLSAGSSETNLVPLGSIAFGGSGANRTITITPVNGLIGSSIITVFVSDGLTNASDLFLLKVSRGPELIANNPLTVDRGGLGIITSAFLAATNAGISPTGLSYTIAPDGQGNAPRYGVLRLNGVPLTAGGTFTQNDINLGLLAYLHNGNCESNDDFTFNVADADGGSTSNFTFRIGIAESNRPPLALSGSGSTGFGVVFHGVLAATDANCVPQALAFRIVSSPSKGDVIIDNANTGAFSYTPRLGESGADVFSFQVNDGVADAAAPGTFTITFVNQPPAGGSGSGTTRENIPFNGTLTAVDPDLPYQPLTFSIVGNPTNGAVVIEPANGTFVYTPKPGAIGMDAFSFVANDGALTSAPAIFAISIRPNLETGDLLVTDLKGGKLVLVDAAGAQAVISSGTNLSAPRGVAMESGGYVLVMDGTNGLIRVDPTNGVQTIVSPGSNFSSGPLGPIGIAVERNGMILVADGTNGLIRINPTNGTRQVLAEGGQLVLPVGVAVAPNGDIYVADFAGLRGQASRVVKVDPISGVQAMITSGENLIAPMGIAIEDTGFLIVSDSALEYGGPFDFILRIDPILQTQSFLAAGQFLNSPAGLATDSAGTVYTANRASGAIVRIDPASGLQDVLSASNQLVNPFGMVTIKSNAVVGSSIKAPRVTAEGRFELRLMRTAGVTDYAIDASPDLNHWTTVTNLSSTNPVLQFSELILPSNQQRFYRATSSGVSLPNPDPSRWTSIPPGSFVMGSPISEVDRHSDEGPQTIVTFTKGIYMAKRLVTQQEYKAVVGRNFSGNAENPAVSVTWSDATNYCALLTQQERMAGRLTATWCYRLPTEAEWDTLVVLEPRRDSITVMILATRLFRHTHGITITVEIRCIRWAKRFRMHGDYTICMEMYGSGAKTGMVHTLAEM